jgi:hypothetical protein
MANSKAIRSHVRKKATPHQRVLKFPSAKGKTITEAELSVSPDYTIIEIVFQDKTSLSFNLESNVRIFPEIVSWKSGEYKPVKRWRPVQNESSRR